LNIENNVNKAVNLDKYNSDEKKKIELKNACRSFESYFLKQFLKEALKDFPSGQNGDFSFEVARDFFIDAFAEKISESKGFGIAEKLYNDLSRYI